MAEGAVALTKYENVKDRSEQVRICDAHADALQIILPEHLNNALKPPTTCHGGTTAALAADCASFVEYSLASGISDRLLGKDLKEAGRESRARRRRRNGKTLEVNQETFQISPKQPG